MPIRDDLPCNRALTTRSQEAALRFARQHDWGREAYLMHYPREGAWIEGLIDAYTLDGVYHEQPARVPATIAALRDFGEY